MNDNSLLKNGLAKINLSLEDNQYTQLDRFYELLVEKNKVMNLTGITEYEEVLIKHFLDSLVVYSVDDAANILNDSCAKIIDIGTGAGFPGIPLKIAFPNVQFTLMDSLNKRINFLNEVKEDLGLSGIEMIHARCEEVARKTEYREQYNMCVSRAVAKLSSLSEMCLPFVKVGGYFIAYKSGAIDDELKESQKAISILGGKVVNTIKFVLPESDYERSFVVIKKVKNTDSKYPRVGGKILKQPL